MSLKDLLTIPENVSQATEIVAGLDSCFQVGFGRLGPTQTQALAALGWVCAGTPLQEPVSTAVDALGRSEFVEKHFAALAAARAALQGAQHDALRAQVANALGRTIPESATPEVPRGEATGPIQVWQESTRNWLMELALAGFGQLEYQTLAPFTATLEHLQGEPKVTRLAAVLTGFLDELLGAVPTSALPEIPIYRWSDLWTRCMLSALYPPTPPAGTRVSGDLSIVGVDLHHHGYFVSFDAYGLLQSNGTSSLVRVTRSAYKVDVVLDAEMWKCFAGKDETLLKGIAEHTALKVDDMTLLPTGDLLWDGQAKAGKPFSHMSLAEEKLSPGVADAPTLGSAAPLDRHPIQIAELVYLKEVKIHTGKPHEVEGSDGTRLPLALERVSRASELSSAEIKDAIAVLGLLRFDAGQWALQPLAMTLGGKKGGEVFTGSSALAPPVVGKKKKGATLDILKERASRLLRKKS